jgi:hypothetical protein
MVRVKPNKNQQPRIYGHNQPLKGYLVDGHLYKYGEVYKVGKHEPAKGTISEQFSTNDFFQQIKDK